VALGANVIEKHIGDGLDGDFALSPDEFTRMVEAIRNVEKAMGPKQNKEVKLRRSLFIVKDVKAGDVLTAENLRSIRPGDGLAPKHYELALGRRATKDAVRGTPLTWELIGGSYGRTP